MKNINIILLIAVVLTSSCSAKYGGTAIMDGILQVKFMDSWKNVCDKDFTKIDGNVACQSMFGDGSVAESFTPGQDCKTTGFWLSEIACDGTEDNLYECGHRSGGDLGCDKDQCIALKCAKGNLDLNLKNESGILEAQYNQEWRFICENGFDKNEADVACRQLQGESYISDTFQVGQDCNGKCGMDFWIDGLECKGDEKNIGSCVSTKGFGYHNCKCNQCVSVTCKQKPKVYPIYIRHNQTSALLYVEHKSKKKALCGTDFNDGAAFVACKDIYQQSGEFYNYSVGNQCDYPDFWLDQVKCAGIESELLKCQHSQATEFSTCAAGCVKLFCKAGGPPPPKEPGLEGNVIQNPSSGVISFRYKGEQKSICQTGFGQKEAETVCFELTGSREVKTYKTGQACDQSEFWLTELKCDDSAEKVGDCGHGQMNNIGCDPRQECVSVFCVEGNGPKKPLPEAKLKHSAQGILSIIYNGTYGAVCDDGFDEKNARIACLELYGKPAYYSYETGFRCDYSNFWLDNVDCSGTEQLFANCPHANFGDHNCDHLHQCVRLICQHGGPQKPNATKIIQNEEGILSFDIDGEIKGICEDGFNEKAAAISCQELYNDSTVIDYNLGQKCAQNDFWLDDLDCTGFEKKIDHCLHTKYGVSNCNAERDCVQLFCSAGTGPKPKDPLLLKQTNTGEIQAIYNGKTRSIGDTNFNEDIAQVVCKILFGLDTELLKFYNNVDCTEKDFWLDGISCGDGEIKNIAEDCQHQGYGKHTSNKCVKVFCIGNGAQPQLPAPLVHDSNTAILGIHYLGETKSLCDDGFDDNAASVACKEKYGDPAFISYILGQKCIYEKKGFWIDDIQCNGKENLINECTHAFHGLHNCKEENSCVKLYCALDGPLPKEKVIYTHNKQGLVSVIYQNKTKSLCHTEFNAKSAQQLCKSFYGDPTVIEYKLSQDCIHDGFWIDKLACKGDESDIKDCPHSRPGLSTCIQKEQSCVKLFCKAGGPSKEESPLIHTSNGMLAIKHINQIKAIGDTQFNQNDAAVACFELYDDPQVSEFKIGQKCNDPELVDFWVDNVNCIGTEKHFSECPNNGFGLVEPELTVDKNCVQLLCAAGGYKSEVMTPRLIHSPTGILMVNYSKAIKGFCDEKFTESVAKVACAELYNESSYVDFIPGQKCPSATADFWIDEITCKGTEKEISECTHGKFGDTTCNANQCVLLYCSRGIQPPIKYQLKHSQDGLVGIEYNNIDGAILTSDLFTNETGKVLCNELYTGSSMIEFELNQTCKLEKLWLQDINCTGSETKVVNCDRSDFGAVTYGANQCIRLFCSEGPVKPPEPGKIVLVDGKLTMLYTDANRNLCDDEFTENSAKVACQELFQDTTVISFKKGVACPFEDFWLTRIVCKGDEQSIHNCPHSDYNETVTCNAASECVELKCAADPEVQLTVHLKQSNKGILSLSIDTVQKGVCDFGFTDNDAKAACNELYKVAEFESWKGGMACSDPLAGYWVEQLNCTGSEATVDECPHTQYNRHNCDANHCVQLYCKDNGPQAPPKAKLIQNQTSGILSMEYNGTQKGICDDKFDNLSASVACQELYGQGVKYRNYISGQYCDHKDFWIDNIVCTGKEKNISLCAHSLFGDHNCNFESECVALFCDGHGPQKPVPPRVKPPTYSQSSDGILSITYKDKTKSVCDHGFEAKDALVACRTIHGPETQLEGWNKSKKCVSEGYWIADIDCVGMEYSLNDCKHSQFGQTGCSGDKECIQLFCSAGPKIGAAPLYHGPKGYLGIKYEGVQKAICDTGFNDHSANVACKELYGTTVNYYLPNKPCDFTEFWVENIICKGIEDRIADCPHDEWGSSKCTGDNCIQLFCKEKGPQPDIPPKPAEPVVALVHEVNGILNMARDNVTRAVCDNNFGLKEAQVACKQMYNDERVDGYDIGQTCNKDNFWLDQIDCANQTDFLQKCKHNGFGIHACSTDKNCVKVFCLAGGPKKPRGKLIHNQVTGQLRYSFNNTVRSFCDDGFDDVAASIACKELYGSDEFVKYYVNEYCAIPDFWTDNLKCQGTETLIADCAQSNYGKHSCQDNSCVNLYCKDEKSPKNPTGKLVHGPTGKLNVVYQGQNRSICHNKFTDQDARVACRELYQIPDVDIWTIGHRCDYSNFWLDSLECTGTESFVDSCQHSEYGDQSQCNAQAECIQLFCKGGGPQRKLGILQHDNETAILTIKYGDEEENICDNGFDDLDARVACQELYNNPNYIQYKQGYSCPFDNFWLDDIRCSGTEKKIQDCPHADWGINNCQKSHSCVKLYCQGGGRQPNVTEIKLQQSSNNILSIVFNGEGRGLCDDGFDDNAAKTACNELHGAPSFHTYTTGHKCDYSSFWIDDVHCQGIEDTISECIHTGIGKHNCDPSNSCIQLYCNCDTCKKPPVDKLEHDGEGILLMQHAEETRGICDNKFNDNNAKVACYELYGDPEFISYKQGQKCPKDKFWLNNVVCTGSELKFDKCTHDTWGSGNCNIENQCVLLYCKKGGPQPSSILEHSDTGILSITYDGIGGDICDYNFEYADAEIACMELYKKKDVTQVSPGHKCIYKKFWLDDIQCEGSEAKLTECKHTEWGTTKGQCGENNCVKLICAGGGSQMVDYTLLHDNVTAILTIKKDDAVKALCDDGFNKKSASVACNQLYGSYGVIDFMTGQKCVESAFWLTDVKCDGNETNINECSHSAWDAEVQCKQDSDCVRLFCAAGGPEPIAVSTLAHHSDGTLGMTFKQKTKGICDTQFNYDSAKVACLELYGDQTVTYWNDGQKCDGIYDDFWLSNVACNGTESKIQQCRHSRWGDTGTCSLQNQCIKLFCKAGNVKYNAPLFHTNRGLLKIEHETKTKFICDNKFTETDAKIACLDLYQNDTVISWKTGQQCGEDSPEFWLDEVSCLGSEGKFSHCDHKGWGIIGQCGIRNCVQVICAHGGYGSSEEYKPQLGQNNVTGILSITYDKDTRAFCDDGFNMSTAEVSCQELFNSPQVVYYETGHPCEYTDFWTDQILCVGKEKSISECSHSAWQKHNCNSANNCIKLYCGNGGAQPKGHGTLSHDQTTGILSYTFNSVPKAICDDEFSKQSAEVACLELYKDKEVESYSGGHVCDYDDFWLDNVQCKGEETKIYDCPHNPFGAHNCNPQKDCIKLFCKAGGPKLHINKIVHDNTTGILQLSQDDVVKHICGQGFTLTDAKVVCKQLYKSPNVIKLNAAAECPNQDGFWTTNVQCKGDESKLLECSYNTISDKTQCDAKFGCIELFCEAGGAQPPATLTQNEKGILSITYLDKQKYMCDDGFDSNAADVACQELYQVKHLSFKSGQKCEDTTHEYWIDKLSCEGAELQIQECQHSKFGNAQCEQNKCVKLFCKEKGPQPPTATLYHNPESGIISVGYEDANKSICDTGFNKINAQVACKQLYGENSQVIDFKIGQKCDEQEFWLDNVKCKGDETNIGDCSNSGWGEDIKCSPDKNCIQLICSGSGPQLEDIAKLSHDQNGILSITYNGLTRHICDDAFTEKSAEVACYELYQDTEVSAWHPGAKCAKQDFWIDQVQCSGNELEINQCPHGKWGQAQCNITDCIQLYCAKGGPKNPFPQPSATLVHDTNGQLSMSLNNETKSVCDTGFNNYSAQVACQQLYNNPKVVSYSYGHACNHDDFWLDNIQCKGSEKELINCIHSAFGQHNCNYQNDCVQLFCAGGGPKDPSQAKDANATKCVVVYSDCNYNGQNYTVCADHPNVQIGWPVKSIKVPDGLHLRIFTKANYEGKELDLTRSLNCIQSPIDAEFITVNLHKNHNSLFNKYHLRKNNFK